MDRDAAVFLPDNEDQVELEELPDGTSASVAELCAHGPSALQLLGWALVAAAILIVAIQFVWRAYADDIVKFYEECENAQSQGDSSVPPGISDERANSKGRAAETTLNEAGSVAGTRLPPLEASLRHRSVSQQSLEATPIACARSSTF
mmetsp:Transcript_73859/g.131052  ORF Transcript_73859/g.131052 Transcript_73859/m.131052 type:complete len:148 (+) Transcript_73859:119-562(+)